MKWVVCHYCAEVHVYVDDVYDCSGERCVVIDGDEVFTDENVGEDGGQS